MKTDVGISLRVLARPGSSLAKWLSIIGPSLDRLFGINSINALYQRGGLKGLGPFDFAERALKALDVSVKGPNTLLTESVPSCGPLLVVCNHPFGGVEALILISALKLIRRDVKLLANAALGAFPELEPLIISTNPLKVSQRNASSIRQCRSHLEHGGVLIVFPAGKVSSYQKDKRRITDRDWHRLVGHLLQRTEASLLPVFFHGTNSRIFHLMGRLWDRSKLLMLPRELLKLQGREICFAMGPVIPPSTWHRLSLQALTRYARVITYLQERDTHTGTSRRDPATSIAPEPPEPLAPRINARWINRELDALPDRQRLLNFNQYSVWFATSRQIPVLTAEIGRERERTFREHDEGSGQARDIDEFDVSYTQLFVWDSANSALVGAYRLGRTDVLKKRYGISGLYLSQMFRFDDAFQDDVAPALELGRSFVVPEYQKSFHALYLLWKGIGRYLLAHPQYRRLYGTVSLSRQYDDRAIALLCEALIEPSPGVRVRYPFLGTPHPELQELIDESGREIEMLGALVRGLDGEGKDLPVLLKHYMKLGAKFHCAGLDPNFNNTPGLLLSVDVASLAPRTLSTFLGTGVATYLEYSPVRSTFPVADTPQNDQVQV